MRIVYVDVNVRYMNRTRNELILALGRCGDLTLVGPGFSVGNSVTQLEELLADPGSIDVLVTTPHIAFATGFEKFTARDINTLYKRAFAFNFPVADFSQMLALNALIARTKVPRALLMLEADYYNFGKIEIAAFGRMADMIFGFGPENWCRKIEMPYLHEELFASTATDYWADFLSTNGNQVSSMHHVIGDDEYSSLPLAERPHSWSIMGVGYKAREVAANTLRANDISPLVTSKIRRILVVLRKLGVLRGEAAWSLDMVQSSFRKRLWTSRYSYTCGSGLEMPVRKFFEIPAAGAVLVCRPFRNARALGFRADENFIECEPTDVMDAHRFLEANPEKAQAIADAGRRLVMEKHSVKARSDQLGLSLGALVKRRGVGRWVDGQYLIS